MSEKVGVLVIHGMGSQRSGFSADLISEVSNRLDRLESRVVWQEVFWADVLKQKEADLWDCMKDAREPTGEPIDLDWTGIRKFVIHNFGDALAYQGTYQWGEKGSYDAIHSVISSRVEALNASLNSAKAPIVVFAHSLGAHMMSNYIWDRQNRKQGAPVDPFKDISTLAGMVTFGANIPLFSLALSLARPIDLPGKGVRKRKLREAVKWLNFLDRDDVLGWPIRPLYEKNLAKLTAAQKRTISLIEDHEINVGFLGTSWNPAAHTKYWTDNDFTKPATVYLKTLIAALDA